MKTYLSSLLLEEQTYFQFPSSPIHQRGNQKSWRVHISANPCTVFIFHTFILGERGGSVVECRTPEREVRGSRPTAAVLCPWARHFTPRKYWLITQEAMAPSRYDWKIVDWDVKPQHNQLSYWVSAVNEHSLWIHISQLSHWTALWPFRTVPLQRPQSALQFEQYQTLSPDSALKNLSSPSFEHEAWKCFSHSSHPRSLSDALQFLHKPHWDLGSFRYPQPGW